MSRDNADARGLAGVAGSSQQTRPPGDRTVVKTSNYTSDCYRMDHKDRGIAVIINNKKFHPSTKMNERDGTDVDANSMYELLNTLGFESILQYDNKTIKEMEDCLIDASKIDHKDSDCFACVILSHGVEGYVYGFDGKIPIEDLVKHFKGDACISLAGKPKLFFIQACRGKDVDHGVTVADSDPGSCGMDTLRIPTEADFLMAYSVVPGYYSWRSGKNGSWFIQAVADVFQKNWFKMDVLTMMTRVNKRVAYDFQSNTAAEDMKGKKQIPCITSMLTKDLIFTRK